MRRAIGFGLFCCAVLASDALGRLFPEAFGTRSSESPDSIYAFGALHV
jgi:hypothetical protein